MQKRNLTPTLAVSSLGLGCMGMSEFYGQRDDAQSMQVLHHAAESGITFFDTADMYGPHHNEMLLGRFLAENKSDVVVATKFGIVRQPGQYARSIDNSPAYARASCEASLKRLGRDHIDLFYVHRLDTGQSLEELMGGLSRLVEEGKIGHVGLCEVSAHTLRRAHAIHPVSALQTEYSLWSREVETSILPTCQELGIGFVPYAPLGRGFLTGRFSDQTQFQAGDFRANLPRFAPDRIGHNQKLAELVKTFAQKKGCSPAQLALAWVLAKGDFIVPIPGTKRTAYLDDNIGALNVTLSPTEVERLENQVSAITILGNRYTDEGMKGVDA